MGIFIDNNKKRDLPHIALLKDSSMNIYKCITLCRNNGFKYAGLQEA